MSLKVSALSLELMLFCFLSDLIYDTLCYSWLHFTNDLQSATGSCCVQRPQAHGRVWFQRGSVNVLRVVLTLRRKKKTKNKTISHSFKWKNITQCTAFKEHHQGENQYSILLCVRPIAGGHCDSFWMIYWSSGSLQSCSDSVFPTFCLFVCLAPELSNLKMLQSCLEAIWRSEALGKLDMRGKGEARIWGGKSSGAKKKDQKSCLGQDSQRPRLHRDDPSSSH